MTAPGAEVAGRYRLDRRLGGGAMGAVWLARDELLGRDVAVKQVFIPLGVDDATAEEHCNAALREGRIAARLSHAHAVSVYDMVLDGGVPWLVMEYLPSASLAQVLAARGRLTVPQVAQVGAQIADALAATHAAGVVHRDVKPGNVLIGEGPGKEGIVKITDFGISRAMGDVSMTQTGVVKGTPAFLAPEVARGAEPNEASDVFSLGSTLYACLEGAPPFGMTENPLEMLYKVAGGSFGKPRHAGFLTRPLMRMLANDPAKRPTMAQVRDQLARLAAGRDRDIGDVLTARTPLAVTLTDVHPVAGIGPLPLPLPAHTEAARLADLPSGATPAAAGSTTTATDDGPPAAPPATVRPDRGDRHRWLWVAAAVLAALLLGGGYAGVRSAGSDSAAAPAPTVPAGSSIPSSAAASTSSATPSSSAGSTSAPRTTTAPRTSAARSSTSASSSEKSSASSSSAASSGTVVSFVTSYYALLPGGAASAYEQTGPYLRSQESRSNYLAFWGQWDSVSVSGVRRTGELTATGTVTFVANGSSQVEHHVFSLVRGDDGELLMNKDTIG